MNHLQNGAVTPAPLGRSRRARPRPRVPPVTTATIWDEF